MGSFIVVLLALPVLLVVMIILLKSTAFGWISPIPYTDYWKCAAAIEQQIPNPVYTASRLGWNESLIELRPAEIPADHYTFIVFICDHSQSEVTLERSSMSYLK